MSIVWIYPYAMEVRQVSFSLPHFFDWELALSAADASMLLGMEYCIGGFADIRDILRYVEPSIAIQRYICGSTAVSKGMDPFNVIRHAIFFLSDPRHLVCVQSRRGMASPPAQVPHTPTCTVAATAACMWLYKDTRYVDTSIVKPEGKSGWPEDTLCGVRSRHGMAYIHQHHVPHTPTCTAVANGMFTATQRYKVSRPMGMYANLSTVRAKVSQGGLEVAVTCSIFTSTRCHTLACIFAATAMHMWYLT
ncbi:hypothetical protein K439DRAFT_1617406 [Ramaria rubella]|nr:hypothetical protein K439DRAFT_1617406 [Ramaria rubella]